MVKIFVAILALLYAALSSVAFCKPLDREMSYYKIGDKVDDFEKPESLRRTCDYNYDQCYDYYYRVVTYNGSASGATDFLWFLCILICLPLYWCLRCFGCIKTPAREVKDEDDHFKDSDRAFKEFDNSKN